MKFRECIIFSSTCFHAYLEICHSSHLSLLFFDISLLHNERENFFSNNRSRVHFVVSNFILFSNFLRIYVYRHFATNAKNFPSDRLHFVVSYSFHFFLHSLFSSFLIFHSCVRVYSSRRMAYKKNNSNCSLVYRTRIDNENLSNEKNRKRIGVNKFFEDHRVTDKKIPRFESFNAYVENQFR